MKLKNKEFRNNLHIEKLKQKPPYKKEDGFLTVTDDIKIPFWNDGDYRNYFLQLKDGNELIYSQPNGEDICILFSKMLAAFIKEYEIKK